MKKAIYLIMALVMMLTVSAVDVEVDCKNGRWDTDICRDFELQDEFDEVTEAINDNTDSITSTNDYIYSNENLWATDNVGGGWGRESAIKYLYNEFTSFLKTVFVTREEFNDMQDRQDMLEAKIELGNYASYKELKLKAAQIKSERTDKEVYVDGYKCNWKLCVKLN